MESAAMRQTRSLAWCSRAVHPPLLRQASSEHALPRHVQKPKVVALAGLDSNPSPSILSPRQRGVRARVLVETCVGGTNVNVEELLKALQVYHDAPEGSPEKAMLTRKACDTAKALRDVVADAVNSKNTELRSLQTAIANSGSLSALVSVATMGEPDGFEALQILCYRNTMVCQQILEAGIVEHMALEMPVASTTLQCAMGHLLTALVAFNDNAHDAVASSGLIPQLVSMCRQSCRLRYAVDDTDELLTRLETRTAAVLRNLAHSTAQHSNLIQAGAVDALADIMRHCKDPKSRINAALAVAILVGHEENNPRLQLDESLVESLLEVLQSASQGTIYLGVFWTVWKLCQGLANLTINDKNKELITARGGVELLADVLFGKHHKNEVAHRYALSAIWNLAFNDNSRRIIMETPGLVEAIRTILATTESPKTKEVAKGALWTLGLEQDIKVLTDSSGHHALEQEADTAMGAGGHIMLSYEWGQQQSVLLIKAELQKAGYQTWMDVDKMSGSTLEAMARAVEGSAAVVVCVSKKYKESQACRTEAEYAFQQRKKIVPILMERSYKATGWLGALMGTRLYFDMSDPKRIPAKATQLFRELGGAGKLVTSDSAGKGRERQDAIEIPFKIKGETPETWTAEEVEDWLKKIKCADYAAAFRERDMDGVALGGLMRMTNDRRFVHEVLIQEFGVSSIGHRLRLIEELHRLFA